MRLLDPSGADRSRVVVLGGGGTIGRALVARLAADGTPHIAPETSRLDLTQVDASDALAAIMRPGDAVIVLAAVRGGQRDSIDTMTANMRIVANIVAAARACRPSHLVYVGSDSVFAFTDALIDEDTVPQPFDLYGLSHFARERLALWASVAPTAIVRLSQVFGASDRHDAYGPARFLRTALTEGRIRLFGGGEELRDHVPLADVTAALDACLKHRGEGVLHVASGRPIAFHAVARIVADAVTPTPVIEEAPRRQPITHRRIAVDRLRATFPWLTPTPLETAVAEVAAVWRASPLHRPGGLV